MNFKAGLLGGAVAAALTGMTLTAVAETPKQGGQLVVALNADIRSTNPGIDRDANTDSVLHHVVETLVAHSEDMGIAPLLADSWEVSEDGKTYTFALRPDATFHNGAPVTAAELTWSLRSGRIEVVRPNPVSIPRE